MDTLFKATILLVLYFVSCGAAVAGETLFPFSDKPFINLNLRDQLVSGMVIDRISELCGVEIDTAAQKMLKQKEDEIIQLSVMSKEDVQHTADVGASSLKAVMDKDNNYCRNARVDLPRMIDLYIHKDIDKTTGGLDEHTTDGR